MDSVTHARRCLFLPPRVAHRDGAVDQVLGASDGLRRFTAHLDEFEVIRVAGLQFGVVG